MVWFGLALFACGGRTLDDGVYGFEGTNGASSCSYAGKTYADGSLLPGVCVCFCNQGQIECEQGCSSPSGGASAGGSTGTGGTSSGGYGAISSGGSGVAGTSSGGTSSAGGSAGGVAGTVSTGGSYGAAGGVGTAGNVGTAGSTGTGGAVSTCGLAPHASGMQPLIDDMEDGDGFILPFDGRSGVWYTYNDATAGFQFPQGQPFVMSFGTGDATGGRGFANTYGKGFSDWGAGMGFVFNRGCPYDASVATGLHFWARSENGGTALYVLFATSATTPTSNNGTCDPTTAAACYDDYQMLIKIDSNWREWYVPYGALTQQGWGKVVKFDPRTLMGVNFQTLYGNGISFSFSVDSVSFY